jgi:hypothetical protein
MSRSKINDQPKAKIRNKKSPPSGGLQSKSFILTKKRSTKTYHFFRVLPFFKCFYSCNLISTNFGPYQNLYVRNLTSRNNLLRPYSDRGLLYERF